MKQWERDLHGAGSGQPSGNAAGSGSEEVADRHDQSRSASSPGLVQCLPADDSAALAAEPPPRIADQTGWRLHLPDPARRYLRRGSTFGNHWITGAQQLAQKQRTAMANDPLGLLAVHGPTNAGKSDADRDLAATEKGVPPRTCRTADCPETALSPVSDATGAGRRAACTSNLRIPTAIGIARWRAPHAPSMLGRDWRCPVARHPVSRRSPRVAGGLPQCARPRKRSCRYTFRLGVRLADIWEIFLGLLLRPGPRPGCNTDLESVSVPRRGWVSR